MRGRRGYHAVSAGPLGVVERGLAHARIAGGAQSFGLFRIDGRSHDARVTFVDGRGRDLHELALAAE